MRASTLETCRQGKMEGMGGGLEEGLDDGMGRRVEEAGW